MLSAHGPVLLLTLVLLVPVALAARSRKRPDRKKPPTSPQEKASFWSLPLIVAMIALGVGIGLGIRWLAQRPMRATPTGAASGAARGSEEGLGMLTPGLAEALAAQVKTTMSQACPRMAASMWGDAAVPHERVANMLSVECLGVICEQSAALDAGAPAARRLPESICQRLFSGMKDRMLEVTNDYRLACPEVAVPWATRPWSPSTELGFYAALRPCLERICEQLVSPQGIPPKYCIHAADFAEGLGDMRAAARLRQRARAHQALNEAMWQELTPEQLEEARTAQDMRLLARRWGEVCRQGMEKYCEFLDKYCAVEGHPQDVCPAGGRQQ
jgi:hypothetical protein